METKVLVGEPGAYQLAQAPPTVHVPAAVQAVLAARIDRLPAVEISALINLGFHYLALGQYERAFVSLEPTLERVRHEPFGVHIWRWQTRLLLGLAEVHFATGA